MNGTSVNDSAAVPGGDPCGPRSEPSLEGQAIKTLVYLLSMLLSLVGNLFVILIVYKNRSMRTTVNYLIVNMAVSDMLQSTIAIPKRIVEIYVGGSRWFIEGIAGDVTCKCIPYLQDICTAVSIQSLVVIAFDRLCGVLFPMRKAFLISTRTHMVIIGFTWLIPMAFHAPYFFTFRLVQHNNQSLCVYSWQPLDNPETHRVNYYLGVSITLFFFPLALLIILYSTIFISLSRRKIPGNESFRNRRRAAQRNRSVLRMVVTVVVAFCICWLPLNLFVYLAQFQLKTIPCFAQDFMFWALFLAYSNAAINPFLYFVFSENYRKGFKGIFRGKGFAFANSVYTRRLRGIIDGRETSATETRLDGKSLKSLPSFSRSSSRRKGQCSPTLNNANDLK